MPANLTPDYLLAEKKFREAETPEEKLACLEEMLATIPKHKGTEKMQADIKRRIARLKAEMTKKAKVERRKPVYHVDKEGAGQIALVGPPNSGKSSLLAVLTAAEPDIADYPFSTRLPVPGMATYANVAIQLVDLPPLEANVTSSWVYGLIKSADALMLVLDAGDDDLLGRAESTFELLRANRIHPVSGAPENRHEKKSIIVANKMDLPGSGDRVALLSELYPGFPVIPVSARSATNLNALRRAAFDLLDIIRIYSKPPGKKPDTSAPFILKKGSTVVDAARAVHKDLANTLKFARVWGAATFPGQMVPRDYVLSDEDVVEFHS